MSKISVEVDGSGVSSGVRSVKRDLAKIKTSANSVFTAFEKLNKEISSLGAVKVERNTNKLNRNFRTLSIAVEGANKSLYDQTQILNKISATLDNYDKKLDKVNKTHKNFKSNLHTSTEGLNSLKAALIGVTGAIGVREVIEYADSWKQVTNLVRLATVSEQELINSRQKLIDISLETRSDLKAQTTLYNRLSIVQKDLGVSQSAIVDVIGTVGKALAVTSTTALEARGSLIQLSQAFGQGIVRAEEFNSIMEGTPRIAKAVADGLGLTRAELRKLVLAGQITSKDFFIALQSQSQELSKEFENVDKTIGQAFTNLRTTAIVTVGAFDDITGASQKFINLIERLTTTINETNIEKFANDVSDLGETILKVTALIGGGRAAAGIIGGLYSLTKALGTATSVAKAFSIAINSNWLALTALAAILGSKEISDAFSRVFGDARYEIDRLNKESLTTLKIRLKQLSQAKLSGNISLMERVLGQDPVKIKQAVYNVTEQIDTLENKLITLNRAQEAGMGNRRMIEDTKKQISYYKDLVKVINDYEGEVKKLRDQQNLLDLAETKRLANLTQQKIKIIQFYEEQRKELEKNISTAEKAKDILSKLKLDPGRGSEQYRKDIEFLNKAIDKGSESQKILNKTVSDYENKLKKLNSQLGFTEKLKSTALTQDEKEFRAIQRRTAGYNEEASAIEKGLVKRIQLGEKSKRLLERLDALEKETGETSVELRKEINKYIEDGAIAQEELLTATGKTVTGTVDGYNKSAESVRKFISDTKRAIKSQRDFEKAIKKLEKPTIKFASFGDEMADGIYNAIDAMNDLNKVFEKQAENQVKLNKLREEAASEKDLVVREERLKKISEVEAGMIKDQITGYRQLFGTTSKMFEENTRERKALHAIEVAFTTAEIALNAEKAISSAVAAIANQGTGDPYTAFARIAAMIATMAGVLSMAGISFGGGSSGGAGGGGGKDPGAARTTGTVLGDPTAMSESTTKTLELLEEIHADEYAELIAINEGIKSLNRNISGLVLGIVRSFGDLSAARLGISEGEESRYLSTFRKINSEMTSQILGPAGLMNTAFMAPFVPPEMLVGQYFLNETLTEKLGLDGIFEALDSFTEKIFGGVIGGSKRKKLYKAGFDIGEGIIGDIVDGVDVSVSLYKDISVKKKGAFGHTKRYIDTITEEVDGSVQTLFNNIFTDIGDSLIELSSKLGTGNLDDVLGYKFTVGRIELKDKTGEEITEEINAVISTTLDQAVEDLFGTFVAQYQKIDEGLYETAVRLITEREIVLNILEKTGQAFGGGTQEAIEFSQEILAIGGSLEKLTDSFNTFYNAFFTDAEKQADVTKKLTTILAEYNLELPTLRSGFKDLISGLDLTTDSGKKTYIALLGLSESADQFYSAVEKLQEKRQELEIQILELEGKSVEALALKRQIELDALDESLRPLQERIYALEDEQIATEKARKAMDELISSISGLGVGNLLKGLISAGLGEGAAEGFGIQFTAEQRRQTLSGIPNISDASREYILSLINATETLELNELSNQRLREQTDQLRDKLKDVETQIEERDRNLLSIATSQAGLLGISDEFRLSRIQQMFGADVSTAGGRRGLLDEFLSRSPEEVMSWASDLNISADELVSSFEFLNSTIEASTTGFTNIIKSVEDFTKTVSTQTDIISPENQLGAARSAFRRTVGGIFSFDQEVAMRSANELGGRTTAFLQAASAGTADPREFRENFNEIARSLNRAEAYANDQLDSNKSIEEISLLNWEIQHDSLDKQAESLRKQIKNQEDLIDLTQSASDTVIELLNLQRIDGQNFQDLIENNLTSIVRTILNLPEELAGELSGGTIIVPDVGSDGTTPTIPESGEATVDNAVSFYNIVVEELRNLKSEAKKQNEYLFATARDIGKMNTREKGWDVNGLPPERT